MSEQAKQKMFYGWVIVASAFVVIFLHLSIRGSFAVFINPMSKDLGWSTAAVSLGLSIFMVCYGLTAFFAGGTVNKYGPKLIFTIHGILFGAGLFLSSMAKTPIQFYITYGVMGGVGAGALFAPPTAMVRQWFMKDLGKAMGLATAGAGLGFWLAPIISMKLITVLSWQQAMKIFGVIVLIGVVIAAQFTKRTPEDMGLKPYGFGEGKGGGASDDSLSLKQAFKTSAFWVLLLMWFCSNFAEYIVFSHAVNYVTKDLGFDKVTATYIYSLIGFCFLIMGIFFGSVLDKYSVKLNDPFLARKRVLAVCYLICTLSALWLNLGVGSLKTTGSFIIYAIVFGIPFGIYIPTVAGYVGTTFGRKYMGPIWGLTTAVGVAGGAGIGPYVGGYLRDLTGSYYVSIWISTVLYAVTVLLVLAVKKPTHDDVVRLNEQIKA